MKLIIILLWFFCLLWFVFVQPKFCLFVAVPLWSVLKNFIFMGDSRWFNYIKSLFYYICSPWETTILLTWLVCNQQFSKFKTLWDLKYFMDISFCKVHSWTLCYTRLVFSMYVWDNWVLNRGRSKVFPKNLPVNSISVLHRHIIIT